MSIEIARSLLGWIQHTPLSAAIRESHWAVMALESAHLLGMTLLGGAAVLPAIAALRRDGLNGLSVAELARGTAILLIAGLAVMTVSGSVIAWSMPFKYALNAAFRVKMLFLLAAFAATASLWRSISRRGSCLAQRAGALLALLLWIAVGLSGRFIGFL